jgi:hemerythrin-like domain-containing protein
MYANQETVMLAAQCAWTILRAEHAQMRQLMAAIDEAVQAGGPELAGLRQRIEALQSFDHHSHRPKGVVLIQALRGRSPDADRLIATLEEGREHDDALLARSLAAIDAAAAGDAHASAECAALLAEHRRRVLHHLEQEDSLLLAQTEKLLTEEEWSRVVSSISSSLYPARPEPGGGTGERR